MRKRKRPFPVTYTLIWNGSQGAADSPEVFDGFGHFQVAMKIVKGEVSLAWHIQVQTVYTYYDVQYVYFSTCRGIPHIFLLYPSIMTLTLTN